MSIHMLPGADTNDVAAAVADLKRNKAALIESQKVVAEIRRAAYLAYLDQGFTEEEALVLCQDSQL